MIVWLAFCSLLAVHLVVPARRAALWARSGNVVDGIGLLAQGVGVPTLRVFGVAAALQRLAPILHASLEVSPVTGFLLSFVAVDFMYYMNHLAFHRAPLWPLHQVHHEAQAMDVLVTSRNTLWTNLLFVYLWVDGLMLWWLADPAPFALGMAITAALDLWRHSDLDPPARLAALLRPWLMLPADHARHHASDAPAANLGANLKLWDRLFGTLLPPDPTLALGRPTGLDDTHRLLWPR